MGNYDSLLSPTIVAGHLFRNRIVMTPTTPQWIQSDEPYPAETLSQYYLRRAKNGAAMITLSGLFPFNDTDNPCPPHMKTKFRFNLDRDENHYLSQLVEGIHNYGCFATIQLQHAMPATADISPGLMAAASHERSAPSQREFTVEELVSSTEAMAEKCRKLKSIGLDGVFLHMSYQISVLGRSLSPLLNHRTDAYGGSFEKRLKLVTDTCTAIKEACGKDFIIEAHITGEERDMNNELIPGGWTIDDSVRFAEAMSGYIDILHLRGWKLDNQHPMWVEKDEPPYLYLAEACKKAVTETKILTTSGHMHPDKMNAIIENGQADLIGVARQLIADPDFVQKIQRDQVDDIVPCIRCNRCFDTGNLETTPRSTRCSVNPLRGWDSRTGSMFPPATEHLRIAVAGGGPAGMEAAFVACKRGHKVDLYEKSGKLGGQLNIADYSPRKWALKNLRDYFVHQMEKNDIELHLGEACTPDVLEKGNYDFVIAAVGAEPVMPDIPGLDEAQSMTILDVYGREDELGENVVIIGGGSSAVETGMHIAEDFGRNVTVLGRNKLIAKDLSKTCCRSMVEHAWESIENLTTVTEATVAEITDGCVVYTDAQGEKHAVEADTVVVAVGMKPLWDEVEKLYGHGAGVITVGDGRKARSVMEAITEGYFAAAKL